MDTTIPKSTPKDVFYHLLAIVTLIVGVIAFIALLFQYINALVPDQLTWLYVAATEIIRRSSASLFVVWPVYVLMCWLIGKDIRSVPEKRELKIRKWLLHLTLFAAAITLIVDLITLLYNFMGGELTLRFALKVASIFVVAGAVFGYYLYDLRGAIGSASRTPKIAAWAVSGAIVVAVIASFFVIGSPATQRAYRFDEQRVQHLQMLQNEILNFWTNKRVLPERLDELTNTISGFKPPVDPGSKQPYDYLILAATAKPSFELCAVFERASARDASLKGPAPVCAGDCYGGGENIWTHNAGRICFTKIIDPELYPRPSPVGNPDNLKD